MRGDLTSDADQLAATRRALAEFRDDPIFGHRPGTKGWEWLNRIIDGYPDPKDNASRHEDYERWICEHRVKVMPRD